MPKQNRGVDSKKINEWIDFYQQKYGELYKLNEEKGQEIAEFQSQLAKLPDVCYNDSSLQIRAYKARRTDILLPHRA